MRQKISSVERKERIDIIMISPLLYPSMMSKYERERKRKE
jgi:hypothetical protein